MVHDGPGPLQVDLKVWKAPAPSLALGCNRVLRPNQQSAEQSISRNRVWRRELPSREDRLDEFESVSNPFDASEQDLLVHAGSWRCRRFKHDLRFDPWLGETAQGKCPSDRSEVVHRAVVNISRDRLRRRRTPPKW